MARLDEIRRVQAEAERLYSEAEVEAAITRIAHAITEQLQDANPIVLTVLNGGLVFAGKLLTQLPFPLELDTVCASRYHGQTRGGGTWWRLEPVLPLQGRIVLLLDDILDEGITLAEVRDYCQRHGAAQVWIAVLIDKDIGREKPCQPDFVGLRADGRYLFGYGLDYKGYLRNAAGIYACRPIVTEGT
jgi:hypoxanthine phosphoribosyltransferase